MIIEGKLGRASAQSRTQCGSGVRSASPSGDRTTTDRGAAWNLRARSRHDADDEIYELEEPVPTAVSQAPRSLP